MFRRFREKKRQERAAQERAAAEERASELAARAENIDKLANQLAEPARLWNEADADCPIVAKRGEEMLTIFEGVSLLESRTRKRTYRGTSHGLSIRIAKGVYYRPGIHSGNITESAEVWTPLDTKGAMVVTNQRVVYTGDRYSREFPFAKLLSWRLVLDRQAFERPHYLINLPVSTRVRTSAVAFPASVDEEIKDIIISVVQCGISLYNGTHEDFIRRLHADAADLRKQATELKK